MDTIDREKNTAEPAAKQRSEEKKILRARPPLPIARTDPRARRTFPRGEIVRQRCRQRQTNV